MYLEAKALLAQVQAEVASRDVVAATVLMALFEYRHCCPERAMGTLAAGVRMAYQLGLDVWEGSADGAGTDGEEREWEREQEKNNLWWALVCCERYVYMSARLDSDC